MVVFALEARTRERGEREREKEREGELDWFWIWEKKARSIQNRERELCAVKIRESCKNSAFRKNHRGVFLRVHHGGGQSRGDGGRVDERDFGGDVCADRVETF